MASLAWTKFFWSDWESDPALKLCSLAAQGLWMRMLCIAASHDPIGYVAVAGRGLSETDLARMTGASGSEVSALLGELDQNGVCSRDAKGRIYSRRMIRDARKSAEARKNGKKGGNPTHRKDTEKASGVNPKDKATLNGVDKPQKPEARLSDTNVSGAAAPKFDLGNDPPGPIPIDPVKALFDAGVQLLVDRDGTTDRTARSRIGQLRSKFGDGEVMQAVTAAMRRTDLSGPSAWMQAWLEKRKSAAPLVIDARSAAFDMADRWARTK